MFKLSANALGMMLAKYRAVFKKCLLKNATILAAGLICCAAPAAATDYTVGGNPGLYNYDTLEELRQAKLTFNNDDIITMFASDNSLADTLSFGGKNVTIDFQDRLVVIAPSITGSYFLELSNGVEVSFDNASKATVSGFERTVSVSGASSKGYGGTVYLKGSVLNADGATFASNSISSNGYASDTSYGYGCAYGGAVHLGSSEFNADGATFKSNSAKATGTGSGTNYGYGYGYGGAVSLSSSELNADGATFESNSVKATGTSVGYGYGGAVSLEESKLYAENAIFMSNSVSGTGTSSGHASGGAIYLDNSELYVKDATFESNSSVGTAYSFGGALYLESNKTLNAEGATFKSNRTSGSLAGSGGAVFLRSSELNVEGATFDSNSATSAGSGYGGAVFLDSNSTLNAKGATFKVNSAAGTGTGSGSGGAVYLSTNNMLYAEGATFESNSAARTGSGFASGKGGAVYLSSKNTINAKGATFVNNTATDYGGAIYATVFSSQTTTINIGADAGQVSTFSGNTANGQANSIYFNGSDKGTNILTVDGEGTLDMLDPMNSARANYNIEIYKTGTGTWKLADSNEFNATGTTFAVNAGTLELYTGASIMIEKGSFSVGENAVLSVIAGKNPAVSAYSVDFDSNSTLNVSGYSGSKEGDTVTLIQSVAEIAKLTNHYTIDGSTSVDYLSAQFRLSNDQDKFEDDKYKYGVLADVALTWYDNRQNPSDPDTHYDQAHGTFTVNGNFELGASLENRPVDETFTNWDGKTLTKKGAGTLTLTGNNTYSGDTVIEDGTLTIKNAESLGSKGNIANNGVLNLFASSDRGTTYNINSYSGSDTGVVGIKATLTAEDQWSDLLNFTNTPQSVNVHFYFADGSDATYLPDDGLQFAHLSTNGTNNTFALNGISSLAGASELVITTSDYQDYFLTATFNPSLAKVYSKASAGELAQASWMHNRELFKATGGAARQAGNNAPGIYVGFGRNDLRHETGSYADIKGNTLTLALALKADNKTAWGLFGRNFDGSYRTSHRASLANGDYTVHSDGDLKTRDVGLFAEYRPQGETENGYYYQAIIRAGRSTNDFSTCTSYGPATFRSGRSLYGFSLGGGYAADIGRDKTADYYSHLIYTKLDGDDVTDSIKQHISLQSSESVRLLSGVQFTLNKDRKVQTYFGAALDYEFSGKADAYIKGLKADGAHLKGLTGILELGLSSKHNDTLTLDLSLQGYMGKKSGLGGTLALSKQF